MRGKGYYYAFMVENTLLFISVIWLSQYLKEQLNKLKFNTSRATRNHNSYDNIQEYFLRSRNNNESNRFYKYEVIM